MHTKLNVHCISATVKVFVWQHCKDFASVYAEGKEKILPQLVTKTRMSVADVTVAWVKIYGLIASVIFTV
jgi:hypothetical protein